MKLCLVYNPKDSKLHETSYVGVFKDMFNALCERFEEVVLLHDDCSAEDIEADVIFFFDPHAQHHIKIDGLDKHKAVKFELWNDPQQWEVKGYYRYSGIHVHKLGRENRAKRAIERQTNYIVCATKYLFIEFFENYFGNNTEKMLIHFPQAPRVPEYIEPLNKRMRVVLGNGTVTNTAWRESYIFRKWAYSQPYIHHVQHWMHDRNTPMGYNYLDFLKKYAGSLALAAPSVVPKYFEIPMAGCVTFATFQPDYWELGFRDYQTCIFVDIINFKKRITDFMNNIDDYQHIADAGRELMVSKYSNTCFADTVYQKAAEHYASK